MPQSECRRDRHEEVTGDDRVRVIASEAGQVGKQLNDDSSQRDHATARRRSRNGVSSSRIQYLRSTAL